MRLGTCVALEAVIGVAVLGGGAVGAWYGIGAARDYAASFQTEASAAASVLPPRPIVMAIDPPVRLDLTPEATAPAIEPAPVVQDPPVPLVRDFPGSPGSWGTVFPAPDDVLLAPLRDARITAAAVNRGGSSLTMRLDLDGGGRGAYKPEQTWPQSARPSKEIAAYRIDRLLGIGHVAPSIGRSFAVNDILAAFDPCCRRFWSGQVRTEGLPRRNGELAGSVSWWIPEIARVKIDGYLIGSTDGIVTWRRHLRIGAVIPEDDRYLVEQISTMTLFDFVIDNIDRWSGGGGGARVAPGGRDVYFMDNTSSFSNDSTGHNKNQRYLERVHVFSRRLVGRLRALTEAALRAALAPDDPGRSLTRDTGPFEVLLTDSEIIATLGRRDFAIAYIDRLIAEHGEAAVLAFP